MRVYITVSLKGVDLGSEEEGLRRGQELLAKLPFRIMFSKPPLATRSDVRQGGEKGLLACPFDLLVDDVVGAERPDGVRWDARSRVLTAHYRAVLRRSEESYDSARKGYFANSRITSVPDLRGCVVWFKVNGRIPDTWLRDGRVAIRASMNVSGHEFDLRSSTAGLKPVRVLLFVNDIGALVSQFHIGTAVRFVATERPRPGIAEKADPSKKAK